MRPFPTGEQVPQGMDSGSPPVKVEALLCPHTDGQVIALPSHFQAGRVVYPEIPALGFEARGALNPRPHRKKGGERERGEREGRRGREMERETEDSKGSNRSILLTRQRKVRSIIKVVRYLYFQRHRKLSLGTHRALHRQLRWGITSRHVTL